MPKKVAFSNAQVLDAFLTDGSGTDIGAIVIENADSSNAAIKFDEVEGWYGQLIVTNDIELRSTLETYEAMAGSPAKMMDKALTGKKVEFDLEGIAMQPLAKAWSNGNKDFTIVLPSTPVNTTVDLTTVPTFTPNHKSIRVADSTGLTVDKQIALYTGDSTYGTKPEILTIEAVDSATDTLYFKEAYQQMPIHGATVNLIAEITYVNKGVVIPTEKMRIIKYNNGIKGFSIFELEKVKIEANSRTLGAKNPSKASFKMSILPKLVITVNSTTSPSVETTWFKERVIAP